MDLAQGYGQAHGQAQGQAQGQEPKKPKGEGLVKVGDGISRYECDHDLYAFIKKPTVFREQILTEAVAPLNKNNYLKEEVLAKINAGKWAEHRPLLKVAGRFFYLLFLTTAYPILFFCYLLPKVILSLIIAVFLCTYKGSLFIYIRAISMAKIMAKLSFIPYEKFIHSFSISHSFNDSLRRLIPITLLKIRLDSIKNFLETKIKHVSRGLDNLLVICFNPFVKAFTQIYVMKMAFEEIKFRVRAWLLQAPFILLAHVRNKVEQFDRFKDAHRLKVCHLGMICVEAIDKSILLIIKKSHRLIHFMSISLGLWQLYLQISFRLRQTQATVIKQVNTHAKFLKHIYIPMKNLQRFLPAILNVLNRIPFKGISKIFEKGLTLCMISWVYMEKLIGSFFNRQYVLICPHYAIMKLRIRAFIQNISLPFFKIRRIKENKLLDFLSYNLSDYKVGMNWLEKVNTRIDYCMIWTIAWSSACAEYTVDQVLLLAVDIERKIPIVGLLRQLQ